MILNPGCAAFGDQEHAETHIIVTEITACEYPNKTIYQFTNSLWYTVTR